jgi:hypothetical protein
MAKIDDLENALEYVRKTRNDADERKFKTTIAERAGMTRALRMVERHIEGMINARQQGRLRDAA